ncbi:MAG: tetratricopeptide repeat protein [Deltaproteobacteria bacterium]|nr:tetratricopeptide repeat protein [Deltaproteobacteria bacterium]
MTIQSENDKPKLQDQKNWSGIPTDPIELLMLSHCDSTKTIKDISLIIAKSVSETVQIINKLENMGIVASSEKADAAEKKSSKKEVSEKISDLNESQKKLLNPELDLDVEKQKQILIFNSSLKTVNPFQMFELDSNASDRDVKRSFQKLTLLYHPDRYYDKNLGPFRELIENIFKIITENYELVNTENKRKSLEKVYHEYFENIKDIQPSGMSDDPERKHTRRRRIRDNIVKITSETKTVDEGSEKPPPRRNHKKSDRVKFFSEGIKERLKKAQIHFEEGKKQLEYENFPGAASHFNLALTFDPQNEEYKKWHKDASKKASAVISTSYIARGKMEEEMGNYEKASNLYKLAAEALPENETVLKTVSCLLKMRDYSGAKDLLNKILATDPENISAKIYLVKVYIGAGLFNRANSTIREVLTTVPYNREAQRLQKEIADHL